MHDVSEDTTFALDRIREKDVAALTISDLTSLFMEGTADDRLSTITRLALYSLQAASTAGKTTIPQLKLLLDLSRAIDDGKKDTKEVVEPPVEDTTLAGWDPDEPQ